MVPSELSELDFWTQFFQAQYFYRDRTKAATPNNMFLQIFSDADASLLNELQPRAKIDDLDLQGSDAVTEVHCLVHVRVTGHILAMTNNHKKTFSGEGLT